MENRGLHCPHSHHHRHLFARSVWSSRIRHKGYVSRGGRVIAQVICHTAIGSRSLPPPSPPPPPARTPRSVMSNRTRHRGGEQLFHRTVKQFRGGLVLKSHRRVNHSTLGSRVIKKKKHRICEKYHG